nr:hypothetical protein [Tanacetum cinerariifolium]
AQQLEIIKLKARVKKLEKTSKIKSSKLRRRVEGLENDKAAQQLEIVKLKARVGTSQRVESSNDVENVFNQGRNIVDMDQDEGIELEVDQEKDAEVEGRHADKQAEIYNIDLDHSSKVLSMQEDDTEVQEAVEVPMKKKDQVEIDVEYAKKLQEELDKEHILIEVPKPMKKKDQVEIDVEYAKKLQEELDTEHILIEVPKPMKKKYQVEMDAEYAKKPQEELDKEHEEAYKNIDWNAALDHVQSKEPQYIKRYHGIKKKPQTKSEVRKNMISYLKNTEGYKMEFFKGKTEEIEKEDEEIIKSINETPVQKAAKRRKLSEEAQEADDLKKRLEIVQDEDDDVFVEATLLA